MRGQRWRWRRHWHGRDRRLVPTCRTSGRTRAGAALAGAVRAGWAGDAVRETAGEDPAGEAPAASEARTGAPWERITTSAAVAAKAATAAICHATRDDIIVSPSGDESTHNAHL